MLTNYSQYEIATLISAIVSGLLGGYVFSVSERKLTRLFGVYTLAISAWSFLFFLMINTESMSNSLFWARALHLPGALIPGTFLHFTQSYLNIEDEKIQILLRRIVYVLGIIFIPASFLPGMVEKVVSDAGFPHYYMGPGPYYHSYIVFFMLTVVIIHLLMFVVYQRETPARRIQILFLFGSYAIGYAGGVGVFLPYYGIRLPIFALYTIPIGLLAIAYSILRTGLMDLGLVIRWTLAFSITIIVLVLVLVLGVFSLEKLLSSNFHNNRGVLSVGVACLLALIFEPLKRKILSMVDTFIFKSQDFRAILSGIELELSKSESIDTLASGLVGQFQKIWKVDHAGFLIWENTLAKYSLYPRTAFDQQIIVNNNEVIGKNDFLIKTLESERRLFKFGIVVDDELVNLNKKASAGEKATFGKIRRTMRWLGAAACIPLMYSDQLLGFIVLGPKKNRTIYNEEDKKFLSHVSESLSLRIRQLMLGDITNESETYDADIVGSN